MRSPRLGFGNGRMSAPGRQMPRIGDDRGFIDEARLHLLCEGGRQVLEADLNVIPYVFYRDVPAALASLARAFVNQKIPISSGLNEFCRSSSIIQNFTSIPDKGYAISAERRRCDKGGDDQRTSQC